MNSKVIDFHVHVGRKEHWYDWIHAYQRSTGSDYYDRYEEMVNPEAFVRYLSCRGITQAVILPEISPITTGIVPNEYVLDFCRGQEALIPFCTINLSISAQPLTEFKIWIDRGAKGLKLYPSYNHFFPHDRRLYPLYDIAQERRLPVLIHTGSSVFRGAKIKYADPIHLDEVAADFPDLVLVMAHAGRGFWYEKAFFLSRIHPNLLLEVSGLPPKRLLTYFPDMEKAIDKFIYGSDWPGIDRIDSNITAIRRLPLSEDAKNRILYGNAAKILGLQ